MRKAPLAFAAVAALWQSSSTVMAETDGDTLGYVEANVLFILYHETGHALIDVLELPVLGQEEDAADVLSVVMTDRLWLEDFARAAVNGAALSYQSSGEEDGSEPAYWGVHGLDEQRFYNIVGLFYGAGTARREDFAADHELPEDRAETCEEEFTLAEESWGGFLDEIAIEDGAPAASSFTFEDASEGEAEVAELLSNEVDDLNALFRLPVTVPVQFEPCGEANAVYGPSDQSKTICAEFIPSLRAQAQANGLWFCPFLLALKAACDAVHPFHKVAAFIAFGSKPAPRLCKCPVRAVRCGHSVGFPIAIAVRKTRKATIPFADPHELSRFFLASPPDLV